MSTITLTGLTEIERARLRYALVLDEETSYEDDPFVDDAMELDISLSDLVVILTTVRDALYELEAKPAKKAADTKPASTRPEKKLTTKKSTSRKNVAWREVVAELASGEVNEFVHTMKTAGAKSAKASLLAKYPGLEIEIEVKDAAMSVITVKVGSYEQGE
jgi:hypothetical protein